MDLESVTVTTLRKNSSAFLPSCMRRVMSHPLRKIIPGLWVTLKIILQTYRGIRGALTLLLEALTLTGKHIIILIICTGIYGMVLVIENVVHVEKYRDAGATRHINIWNLEFTCTYIYQDWWPWLHVMVGECDSKDKWIKRIKIMESVSLQQLWYCTLDLCQSLPVHG